MRLSVEKAFADNTLVAEYDDLYDFGRCMRASKYADNRDRDSNWAGGTYAECIAKCESGDASYTRRSEKLIDKIAEVAVEGMAIDMDYNLVHGMLDYGAMVAGDPMCMYGTTITESNKSPVTIYIDNWISSTTPNEVILRRGAAVLALVQALTLRRPVMAKFVAASGCSFDRRDNVQLIPVPTAPMDLSRAAWMLGSVTFTRAGVYTRVNDIYGAPGLDSGPTMGKGAGKGWQQKELGAWAAARDGVSDYVFLPMLFGREVDWSSDAAAVAWVNKQVARFAA